MKIKIVNGKWNCKDALLDLFINSKRELKKERERSKIGKEHNYRFQFRNREIEDIEVNDCQILTQK